MDMKGLFNWLNKTKVFRDLSPQEFSWVLYDVGNSAYTMLACSLIPIWFKDLAIGTNPGQITGDQATAYYSIAISIVTVIVALLGPVFGALQLLPEYIGQVWPLFMWGVIIVAAIGCCMGFKEFVWFMSVGYGFAVMCIGAYLLIFGLVTKNLTPTTSPSITTSTASPPPTAPTSC